MKDLSYRLLKAQTKKELRALLAEEGDEATQLFDDSVIIFLDFDKLRRNAVEICEKRGRKHKPDQTRKNKGRLNVLRGTVQELRTDVDALQKLPQAIERLTNETSNAKHLRGDEELTFSKPLYLSKPLEVRDTETLVKTTNTYMRVTGVAEDGGDLEEEFESTWRLKVKDPKISNQNAFRVEHNNKPLFEVDEETSELRAFGVSVLRTLESLSQRLDKIEACLGIEDGKVAFKKPLSFPVEDRTAGHMLLGMDGEGNIARMRRRWEAEEEVSESGNASLDWDYWFGEQEDLPEFTWDEQGRMVSCTWSNGHRETYEYTEDGYVNVRGYFQQDLSFEECRKYDDAGHWTVITST